MKARRRIRVIPKRIEHEVRKRRRPQHADRRYRKHRPHADGVSLCGEMKRRIEQLTIGADPGRWTKAGFVISRDAMRAGEVLLAFAPGEGVLGWRLSGFDGDVDGLPVESPSGVELAESAHPNGVVRVDHLVVFTPDLERTTTALEGIDVERRRVREVEADGSPLRQGFFRLGEVILEVVEHANVEPGPARFWGITFAVADLDVAAEVLGDRLGLDSRRRSTRPPDRDGPPRGGPRPPGRADQRRLSASPGIRPCARREAPRAAPSACDR